MTTRNEPKYFLCRRFSVKKVSRAVAVFVRKIKVKDEPLDDIKSP